jgi:hypothetical protein
MFAIFLPHLYLWLCSESDPFPVLLDNMLRFLLINDYLGVQCRVDVSPTDVSLTENSWMFRPLNKASHGYCVPDRCVLTLDHVKHGTSSACRYGGLGHLMDQWGV